MAEHSNSMFAEMSNLGYEGDHYDIPEQLRAAAVEQGAVEFSSRTLVEALYKAGIRQRPSNHGTSKQP